MTLLFVLQSFIDIALIYCGIKLYLTSRRTVVTPSSPNVNEWETMMQEYRDRCDDSLKRLHHICEQANRILQQNKSAPAIPSREENELKEVLSVKPAVQKIPSLEQIENTRIRLKKDIPLDLKTLLKDQLA
jgi:hypothetical protein